MADDNDRIDMVEQHLRELLVERDLRYQQRFDAQTTAINAAMAAVEKANDKSEISAEKRFELLNELRQGVATKQQFEALEKQVFILSKRVDTREGRGAGLNASWVYILAAVGAAGTIISAIVLLV